MRTVLRFLFVIPIGYVAACLTAAFAMLWPFLDFDGVAALDPVMLVHTSFYFAAQAAQIGGVAILPWAAFMIVTELFGISSVLVHAIAGFLGGLAIIFLAYGPDMVPTSVETAILVAATTFGLVYWIVAGRGAGSWRRRSPSPAAEG